MPGVRFEYFVGLGRRPFAAATLVGSWDRQGRPSHGAWSEQPMRLGMADDGDVFFAGVALDDAAVGAELRWGVMLERGDGTRLWGVMTEVADLDRRAQERAFTLAPAGAEPQREAYHLTQHRRLGARPLRSGAVRFGVWAPNARAVEVVFGGPSGYIANDGHGIDPQLPVLALQPDAGLWTTTAADFAAHVGRRYMYRVTRDDGQPALRSDMYSLQQCGAGGHDPAGGRYDGSAADLDGTASCTVVVDPADDGFWADELDPGRPVPRRLEDLVIYELHVGALNPATEASGTFADAIGLLPHLEDLGVNAVELLPMFEFNGSRSWGYGSSHFLAPEASAGGRDGLRRFVKACHQRGIAVLLDVVYNHYAQHAERAAWEYDSAVPSRNVYYWHEDPPGRYLDNVSSGWAPRYHEEQVRRLFVSSAALLLDEFHADGLRVDQTTSMHAYNRLQGGGPPVPAANVFGRKLLRELCQTLKATDPAVMLIAEDHSGWDLVTQPADSGGIGFDATWDVGFYHHLIGDKDEGPEHARLLHTAARLHEGALAMGSFGDALAASARRAVVYVESHDEAGNATASRRTIRVAVDGAPLVGATRRVAESRVRFAAGMALLAAGTPMFLMGEEVGAQQDYTFDRFTEQKEDLLALRAGDGARLFRFYRDVIRLRLGASSLRSRRIEILRADDAGRLIAFRRWDDTGEHLVVGSLAERPYDDPDYRISHPRLAGGGWHERFNSDATVYGGDGVGNRGATLRAGGDELAVVVPASGFVVFRRTA